MRVLINAASANMGGAVTYLRYVLAQFPLPDKTDHLVVVAPEKTINRLALEAELSSQVEWIAYPQKTTFGFGRFYFDQVILPRWIRNKKIDVLFSTTGFGSWKRSCPELLLVRNFLLFSAEYEKNLGKLSPRLLKNRVKRFLALRSMHQADRVLFPSSGLMDAAERTGAKIPKKATVLPYGFDHAGFLPPAGPVPDVTAQMNEWRNQGLPVLLYVSHFAVHKNFGTLIAACQRLAEAGQDFRLVLTTNRDVTGDKAEYDRFTSQIKSTGLRQHVIEAGSVPYSSLPHLYKAADLFVFPSFTESFGHPMVEAMACGLPVVAADTTVNREVCASAGSYFNPFDPVDCARVLQIALTADNRDERSSSSLERSRFFDWQAYAVSLHTILSEMAERG